VHLAQLLQDRPHRFQVLGQRGARQNEQCPAVDRGSAADHRGFDQLRTVELGGIRQLSRGRRTDRAHVNDGAGRTSREHPARAEVDVTQGLRAGHHRDQHIGVAGRIRG